MCLAQPNHKQHANEKFDNNMRIRISDQRDLKTLGRAYFIYMFIYSGLEFTLTFLTHHTFGFTSMQQGWMFLAIGLIMAILQGGWVRHVPPNRTRAISELVRNSDSYNFVASIFPLLVILLYLILFIILGFVVSHSRVYMYRCCQWCTGLVCWDLFFRSL